MFSTGGYSLADISAATGGSGRSNDGLFGNNGAWIIIILFLFVFLGWGKNGFNGSGNDGGGSMPTILNLPANGVGSGYSGEIQRGFDTSAVIGKLDRLGDGICSLGYDQLAQMNGINQNISNGFHGVDNAICTLGYNMQQGFNTTNVALMQGQNALQAQLAQCCCENREGQAQIRYDMATQACETRQAIADSTRQVLDFLTADKIATLQAENQSLKFQASQTAQNQFITQVGSDIVNRLQPTAVPAYPAAAPCGLGNWSPQVLANGYGYNNCSGCNC